MRTWQQEIRMLGVDFFIKKEIVDKIIKQAENDKTKSWMTPYDKAQRELFKYM